MGFLLFPIYGLLMGLRLAALQAAGAPLLLLSLQNRRISGVRSIHERAREARGQKNPQVITPLFMLFRPQTHPT